MRFHFVRASILSCLCWPASGAAGSATVKVESAAVYSQRSTSAEVVKSLKKGDPVVVEMALAGEGGEWCSVREPDQKVRLGYMRCEQLEREQRRPPVVMVPEPAAPPRTPQMPAAGGRAQPAPGDYVTDYVTRSAAAYMDRLALFTGWPGGVVSDPSVKSVNVFEFTTEQQARVESLANQMGVPDCRQWMAADSVRLALEYSRVMRSTPVDPRTKAMKVPQRAKEIERQRVAGSGRCDMKMQELLERVLTLLTPEQQRVHAADLEAAKKTLAWGRYIMELGRRQAQR